MNMECNVGGNERKARIGIGSALIGTSLFAPVGRTMKIAAGAVGVFGLVTGLAKHCPMSQAMGRNTCDLLNVE